LSREAGGRHPCRGLVVVRVGDGLKTPAGLLQQRQGLLCSATRLKHLAQREEGTRKVVVRTGIGGFPRRLGLLQQLLRPCQRLLQLPSRQLLLDAGAAGLKSRGRGAFTQGGGGGLAHPCHPLQQTRFAQRLQQAVEIGGPIDCGFRIGDGQGAIEQGKEIGQLQQRQRCRQFRVLSSLLIEEIEISGHRLQPARREPL
jgi:hypothetical protein